LVAMDNGMVEVAVDEGFEKGADRRSGGRDEPHEKGEGRRDVT